MTKREFDLKYRSEKVAVHCDTEEKAMAFLSLAKSFGYKWVDTEDDSIVNTYWESHKSRTCYDIEEDDDIMFAYTDYYKDEGYKIIPFELDEPKETFNIGDMVTYKLLGVTAKIVDIKPHYLLEGYGYYVDETKIKKVKPLKKITKKELADMGYEMEE